VKATAPQPRDHQSRAVAADLIGAVVEFIVLKGFGPPLLPDRRHVPVDVVAGYTISIIAANATSTWPRATIISDG